MNALQSRRYLDLSSAIDRLGDPLVKPTKKFMTEFYIIHGLLEQKFLHTQTNSEPNVELNKIFFI